MRQTYRQKAVMTSVAAFMVITHSLSAQSIDWGNTVLDGNYQSDGTTLLSDGSLLNGGGFTFELGVFTNAFSPTASNISLWSSNWQSLDSDPYNQTGSFNEFGDTGILNNNVSLIGEQVYIWGYDDLAAITAETPNSQAVLLSNDGWTLSPTDQTGTPQQFFVSGANEAVFGAARVDPDGNGGNAPFTVQGGGDYTLTGATEFEIQTATFPDPIPEPSSSILAMLGSLLMLRRRR